MSVPWPPPKVPALIFQTPPAGLVDNGSKRKLKGNEALKWLWQIDADTPARSDLPEYPFRFQTAWRRAVMTANVHSAREMAASVPIARLWSDAGRCSFGSEEMVRGLCAALKLKRTVAKGDFTADMQPFATCEALDALGVEVLRLTICAHASMDLENVTTIIASAALSWKNCQDVDVPQTWQPFVRKLIQHCKNIIGKTYAYAISQWQCVPDKGKERIVPPDEAKNAVNDALHCSPDPETAEALRTLRRVYGAAPDSAPTPYATILGGDIPPILESSVFEVPKLEGSDALVQAL